MISVTFTKKVLRYLTIFLLNLRMKKERFCWKTSGYKRFPAAGSNGSISASQSKWSAFCWCTTGAKMSKSQTLVALMYFEASKQRPFGGLGYNSFLISFRSLWAKVESEKWLCQFAICCQCDQIPMANQQSNLFHPTTRFGSDFC